MPRRIATGLPNTISRLLQGSYLKTPPRIHQVLLDHPPVALAPRASLPRSASANDLPSAPRVSRKAAQRNIPWSMSLSPRPITYLADIVRRRFYEDHPWERARVVTLTEGKELASPLGETNARKATAEGREVDLSLWSKNPSAEDVIGCTLYQHRTEDIALSVAYHHTLSSYYSLRAQHEHANRAAVLEARAYGATFDPTPETTRAFKRAEAALTAGALHIEESLAAPVETKVVLRDAKIRFKPTDTTWTAGADYMRNAIAARDGAPLDKPAQEPKAAAQAADPAMSDLENLLSGSTASEAKQPSVPLDVDALVADTKEQSPSAKVDSAVAGKKVDPLVDAGEEAGLSEAPIAQRVEEVTAAVGQGSSSGKSEK